MEVIIIDEPDKTLLPQKHISSPVNTYLTLCGWVDVPYHTEQGYPDCPSCLEVVKYCKKIRIKS
jgi:hypothetical protein